MHKLMQQNSNQCVMHSDITSSFTLKNKCSIMYGNVNNVQTKAEMMAREKGAVWSEVYVMQ